MKQAACCLFLVFSFFLFPLGLGRAEHTPDHRFTVSGYVYDETGSPQPGLVVVKDRADNILGTTLAGSSGYYQIRLHLHDSDLGKKLYIHSSEAGQKDLIVKFEPNDTTTERTAEVNFGKVPPSSGLGTYTLLGGSALLLAAVIYAVSRKRKSRKQPHGKKKQR